MIAHIIPAKIIRQNQHDIRRFGGDTSDRNEQKTQRTEFPHSVSDPEEPSHLNRFLSHTEVKQNLLKLTQTRREAAEPAPEERQLMNITFLPFTFRQSRGLALNINESCDVPREATSFIFMNQMFRIFKNCNVLFFGGEIVFFHVIKIVYFKI